MASSLNLNITQGSDFAVTVVATDDFGAILNLTDYTVGSLVKHRYGDTSSLFRLNATVSDAAKGEISLLVTPAQSEVLPVGRFLYGIELKKGTATAFKILNGYIDVIPEINN